jgi:serine/threonine protein phosphatase PrpC
MRIRPGVEVCSLTDVGCQRQNNEDSYSYWEPESDDQFQQKGRLAIVADGMGGYEGGQEASRLAVDTILEIYKLASADALQPALLEALRTAHDRIRAYADTHPEFNGMGTTCTAIAIHEKSLYFAHVGDSRLYRVRGSQIEQLTTDHSYVARLVAAGMISPAEAETHPQRHILTAALGAGTEIIPEGPDLPIELAPDDRLLLCTDGLWGLFSDEELRTVIDGRDIAEACRTLVSMARERGGPDNITLQILLFKNAA